MFIAELTKPLGTLGFGMAQPRNDSETKQQKMTQ